MTDLEHRVLGRTGLPVTVLGFGAMELRGPPKGRPIADEQAAQVLNAALDGGINYIDTSIDYGVSEELIGRHVSHRRDEYFLASKCGCVVGWQPSEDRRSGPHDFSRDNIIAGVEQSLRRLQTAYLDLVQVHWSLSPTVLQENDVIDTLNDLRQQGKTRFIGMSGKLPDLPAQIEMGVFDAFQVPYSAVERDHEELIADAARNGAGVIVRGGTGEGTPSGDPRAVQKNPDLAAVWARAGLADLMDGAPPMEFALRFTITHPDISTAIVGTQSPEHATANIEAAAKGPLPLEVYDEAKRRLAAAGSAPDRDGRD